MTTTQPKFTLTSESSETRVFVEPNALNHIGKWVLSKRTPPIVVVVSDTTVADLYGQAALSSLADVSLKAELISVPPGDQSKSISQLDGIFEKLGGLRVPRDGMLIALGGGVVTDLTGFAAATWMRGIDYANCPTTLEADVDAALGGKTGINHAAGKNMIGAFHHPRFVAVDPTCLKTLPARDIAAGLAESIKHALICDPAFLDWHEANAEAIRSVDPIVMSELVTRNLRIKANVVEQDERESCIRACLNFGHTIGHAVEKLSEYQLRHGEAVSIGMHAAALISMKKGMLDAPSVERVKAILKSFALPIQATNLNPTAIIETTLGDKKVKGGKRQWVLLDGIGKFVITDDVDEDSIEQAVNEICRF
ncbi:MAG: 3-dehydroquinate synthase [Phycisphaerae bacterium]|nr:MAG: 3-dehydroquinate synthase [Phycisphaerae bacterium]